MSTRMPSFEIMAELARSDPRAFEQLRKKLTQDAIAQVRGDVRRQRLQGLQLQIDMERRKSTNPIAGCIRISQMMSASLMELHKALNGIPSNAFKSTKIQPDAHGAKILAFRDRRRDPENDKCLTEPEHE